MLPRTGLPLANPVSIRWDEHQIPFIEAESDTDLGVALGIVHAHLRLGQLELMRRLAQGRVAEMIGAAGIPADQLLLTLDVGRAVPAMLSGMPATTLEWLSAFTRGINHYLMHVRPLPSEFAIFALRPEQWTVSDVLTLGRLASADVNWILWFQLLRFHRDSDWPLLWRRLLATGGEVSPIAAPPRAGSNSFVVGASRSASGSALIASDPHLSMVLPNTWLLAGYRSPSYHAAGLMLPGLPFVALGRNPWIAWGGTSLHAASSDLVAVPGDAPLTERQVELAVRWGRPRTIRIRESQWGPVLTDVSLLSVGRATLALRWMGHRPSDEMTAMLAANRARDLREFRAALNGFGVPGQNMLCAEATGRIGRMMAVHLPRRDRFPDDIAVQPTRDDGWEEPVTGADLPFLVDPPEGFITSANEKPSADGFLVGRHFSTSDRKRRLEHLLTRVERCGAETVMPIQRDAHWQSGHAQCQQILGWVGSQRLSRRQRRIFGPLRDWDGNYDAASHGALIFEVLCYELARVLVSRRHLSAYAAAWGTRRLIWSDIVAAEPQERQRALRTAMRRVARDVGAGETWGDRHRLRIGHPLALLPIVGSAWRFTDDATSGTSDSLMKTAHSLTARRHGCSYGSVARHISDCADPDANYFVLLGGQDGWMGSTTFLDQVPLWQRGDYIQLPLRRETVDAMFHHETTLTP